MQPGLHGRRRQCAGFSLIELAAIVVILAILAAVAAPSLARIPGIRTAVAAEQLAGDLGFARGWALATGVRCWVVFDLSAQEYCILVEDSDAAGRGGATPLMEVAQPGPSVVSLGSGAFQGIQVASVDFDGGAEVGFDDLGRPLDDAEDELRREGVVTLSTGHTIHVATESGVVSYAGP